VKYLDQKRAAAQYHRDLTGVNVAKGLELTQRQRGKLLSGAEYDELEATAILTVYMVQLHVSGLVNDETAQRRMMERARKMAEAKLEEAGHAEELEVEPL
jgi:hypothetical protein